MKRFAALMLILGLFTIGCAKPAETPAKPADEPAAAAQDDAAAAAPADEVKDEAKEEAKTDAE